MLVGGVIGSPALAQSCTVTSAWGAYGNVTCFPALLTISTSTFTVTCTGNKNKTIRLCLELAAGSPADGSKRALSNGAKFLDHEFYSDASRTQLWGSWGSVVPAYGTGGVSYDLALGNSTSANHTFTVYARVLASQQTASPLSYTWSATSPGLRYAYVASAACPTGGSTATGGTMLWTATVPANCLVSTTGVNFGSSGAITANVDATGSAAVQCTSTTPYIAALNGGNSGAADPTQRKMVRASESITYGLYRDAARSQPWGSTAGTNTLSGTGSGSSQALTVYGRVAAQATPSPGAYTTRSS